MVITTVVFADHVLYWTKKISLIGYSTDQIVFWIWFVCTILVFSINIRKKIVWMSLVIVLITMPFIFFSILFYASEIFPFAFGEVVCEKRIDNRYRLQTEQKKISLSHPTDYLVKEFFLFEKEMGSFHKTKYVKNSTLVGDSLSRYNGEFVYDNTKCLVKSARFLSLDRENDLQIELTLENGVVIVMSD